MGLICHHEAEVQLLVLSQAEFLLFPRPGYLQQLQQLQLFWLLDLGPQEYWWSPSSSLASLTMQRGAGPRPGRHLLAWLAAISAPWLVSATFFQGLPPPHFH